MIITKAIDSCKKLWPSTTWARVLLVRIVITLWALLMGQVGRAYDTSVLIAPGNTTVENAPLDAMILSFISPLCGWDGVYFAAIARGGYEAEEFFAFFPGFPFVLRIMGDVMQALLGGDSMVSRRPALLFGGVIFNIFAGIAAALALERLSLTVGRPRQAAARDALIFAAGPLGVFGSALYSENLFAALTFSGLAELENAVALSGRNKKIVPAATSSSSYAAAVRFHFFIATLLLIAAAACRANGMLGGVFILLATFRVLANVGALANNGGSIFCIFFFGFFFSITITIPFAALALHAATLHCDSHTTTTPPPLWCTTTTTTTTTNLSRFLWPPPVYAHVQKTYWDAGVPFGRWTATHSPALLLALPAAMIAACALYNGLVKLAARVAGGSDAALLHRKNHRKGRLPLCCRGLAPSDDIFRLLISSDVPYALHLAALVTLALIAAHAQVSTRLAAAASPMLSWYISDAWGGGRRRVNTTTVSSQQFYIRIALTIWCGGYTLIGAALFCNAFNWT